MTGDATVETDPGVSGGDLAGRRGRVVPVVRRGAGMVFGAPSTIKVEEGKRSLLVLVDRCRAGAVAEVNGRLVAMDADHYWHDVDSAFDGVALLVNQWVTS